LVATRPDCQRESYTLGLGAGFGRPVVRDDLRELVGDPVRIGTSCHPHQPLSTHLTA
jgi:hypothetical protein